jgi:hypothetical protein
MAGRVFFMNGVELVMARATEPMAHLRAKGGHSLKSSNGIKRKSEAKIKQFVQASAARGVTKKQVSSRRS